MRIGNIRLEFEIPGEKGRWQLVEGDGYNFLLQQGEELRKG